MSRRPKIPPPERIEKYRALLAGGAPEDTAYKVAIAGLTCGATTRAGHPCRAPVMWWAGRLRCRMHGSGGPVTIEGRQRSLLNLKQNRK